MMAGWPSPVRLYLRFLLLASATVVGIILLGYFPTVRLGGKASIPAMLAACGVSAVASALGGLPILLMGRRTLDQRAPAVLASMVLRLVVVVAGAIGVSLTGWLDRGVFLIWVAISYLALLVADTGYAVSSVRSG
jgi:hypothetical protein